MALNGKFSEISLLEVAQNPTLRAIESLRNLNPPVDCERNCHGVGVKCVIAAHRLDGPPLLLEIILSK